MAHRLLTRDAFRDSVFRRDNHRCVVCGEPAVDAHHILDRKLWPDGGYYLANGASVCEAHHMEAERTTISCEELRRLAGITDFPAPPHLSAEEPYDKWGNPLMPDGSRLRGEMYHDPAVQKILGPALALFRDERVKYARTYHLPWSPGLTSDDRVLEDLDEFVSGLGGECVVTVKMDGENTSLYHNRMHARSLDYHPHPSRSWVRAMHGRIAHEIPDDYRICGENLYARHSIAYENLADYFQVFSIWDERNVCLSWDETLVWAELLGLVTVPVLYRGPWDERLIRNLYRPVVDGDPCEGYVVRPAEGFHYRDFRRRVAKFVRAGHVTTDQHWKDAEVVPNKLRKR